MITTSPDPTDPGAFAAALLFPGCYKTTGDNANVAWSSMRDWVTSLDVGTVVRHIITGDWTYKENVTTDVAVHREEMERVQLKTGGQGKMTRDFGADLMVSDHEFQVNNGESFGSTSLLAGYTMIAQVVAQPTPPDPGARYYAYNLGPDVRVIILDTRSIYCSLSTIDARDAAKTMLGATQLAWFQTELARTDRLKIVVSDKVWQRNSIVPTEPDDRTNTLGELHNKLDAWPSYQIEQELVAGWIGESPGTVIMVTGDYHGYGYVTPEDNRCGDFLVLHCNGMNVKGTYRQQPGDWSFYFSEANGSSGEEEDDGNPPMRNYGRMLLTSDTQTITLKYEAVDALRETIPFVYEMTYGLPGRVAGAPYALISVDDRELHDDDQGWRQMEVPSALNGQLVQEEWETDPGKHEADAGRPSWRPGLLGVPIIISGNTKQDLRDKLGRLRRICSGNVTVTATYPDTQQRWADCQGIGVEVLPTKVYHGLLVLAKFTVLTFWRDMEKVISTLEIDPDISADGMTWNLDAFAECTAPLVDLDVLWTGPASNPEIRPQDRGKDMDPQHKLIYRQEVGTDTAAVSSNRTLLIDGVTGALTGAGSGGSWDPNYFQLQAPGSTYLLEIPPGFSNPRALVFCTDAGASTAVQVEGYRAFVSL